MIKKLLQKLFQCNHPTYPFHKSFQTKKKYVLEDGRWFESFFDLNEDEIKEISKLPLGLECKGYIGWFGYQQHCYKCGGYDKFDLFKGNVPITPEDLEYLKLRT